MGTDVEEIVREWVRYLTADKLFGPTDPLFPKTHVRPDQHGSFAIQGLSREHWADAGPVRAIFKAAFARAGLPYFKPHTVRDTLTQLIYRLRLSPEQLKAFSQSLGHASVLTTLGAYGHVSLERQSEILAALPQFGAPLADGETIRETVAKLAEMVGRHRS